MRHDHMGRGIDQKGTAIRCGARGLLRPDQPIGAGAILHHERLAERALHGLRDDAAHDVGGPSGRIRHNETHRAAWPFRRLRPRGKWQ